MLTRKEIQEALARWDAAWKAHDLQGVMELFHDDVLFDNWTGARVRGKEALHRAWAPWFAEHGGFLFTIEDIFIDEAEQKVSYQWYLDWPSGERGFEGKPERRRGVDIMHFKEGKIIKKMTYSKTTIEIDGSRVKLSAVGG
jgi:ketosteroid isomerase-like protein